jgi:hypothetical protein
MASRATIVPVRPNGLMKTEILLISLELHTVVFYIKILVD